MAFLSLFFSWGGVGVPGAWLSLHPLFLSHVFFPYFLLSRIFMELVYQNIQFGRQNYGDCDAKKNISGLHIHSSKPSCTHA